MLWFKIVLTIWFSWGAIKMLGNAISMNNTDKYENWAVLIAVVIMLAVYGLMIMGVWVWL